MTTCPECGHCFAAAKRKKPAGRSNPRDPACVEISPGRWLWTYSNGRQLTASFAFDAARLGKIKVSADTRARSYLTGKGDRWEKEINQVDSDWEKWEAAGFPPRDDDEAYTKLPA